eukprot:PhF_6_TR12302/c0_g1_i2/m.19539/K04486/E3.1.3.15B; histidinol-phosphatase (PHP family)
MSVTHHSHSGEFCNHGQGTLEQMVEEYYTRGFHVVSLTEHMPRPNPENLYEEEIDDDITVEDLADTFDRYVAEARRLQKEYKGKMIIHVGMETENIDKDTIPFVHELNRKYNLDMMVGSVHHCGAIPLDMSSELMDKAVELYGGEHGAILQYLKQQHDLIASVRPPVIGHFDVVRRLRDHMTFHDNREVWELAQKKHFHGNRARGVVRSKHFWATVWTQ